MDELSKYVQLPDLNALTVEFGLTGPAHPLTRAIVGVNTNWQDLNERGLLGPESFIEIEGCRYKIDPRSFPMKTERTPYVPNGFGGNRT